MGIINLTQHKATPEQIDAGVVDLPTEEYEDLVDLLALVDEQNVTSSAGIASDIALYAASVALPEDRDWSKEAGGLWTALIDGAPQFKSLLRERLRVSGLSTLP